MALCNRYPKCYYYFVYSVAESDSVDAESGFEEADPGEAGNNVIKMVSRFVDKVSCTQIYCNNSACLK